MDTVRQLYLHSLLDNTDKRMTVHHRAEIIHSVSQRKGLRVCVVFAHFLYTTMDIAKMRIYFLDNLTIENCLQTEHTVCRRMLRANINNEIIACIKRRVCFNELTIFI